jgi:hypothetical protein
VEIQTEPFRKVAAAAAAEICDRVELSSDARAYLLPNLSPQAYLALLVEADLIGDAVRFVAFSLPIREGIWWACVVAHSAIAEPTEREGACLEHAAAWVYEPSEERRRQCMAAAESSSFQGAAAYAALAVFWSGGSLAPEGMPEAPADPSLGPIGVGASVLLSITQGDPLQLGPRFKAAIRRATDIANGGNGRLEGDRAIKRGRE